MRFTLTVVELVHQRHEAPRLVLVVRVEHGHAGDDDGLVLARDLDVVVLAARAAAQCGERRTKPRRLLPRTTAIGAALDLDRAAALRAVRRPSSANSASRRAGVSGAPRREVGVRLRELAQAVVGARRPPRAPPRGAQAARWRAGSAGAAGRPCRDPRGARWRWPPASRRAGRGLEQATEDHGVGDVGDEQLVEAQHAGVAGDRLGHLFQRRRAALAAGSAAHARRA